MIGAALVLVCFYIGCIGCSGLLYNIALILDMCTRDLQHFGRLDLFVANRQRAQPEHHDGIRVEKVAPSLKFHRGQSYD